MDHFGGRFLGAFLPFALPWTVFALLIGFGPFRKGLRWRRRDLVSFGLLVVADAVVDACAALGPRGHLSAGTKWAICVGLLPAAALCVANALRTFADAFKANARLRAMNQ